MQTGAEAMAKKKMGRPKTSERDDQTAKIDRTILSKAKMVAADRAIPLAEYLSETLRSVVERDFVRIAQRDVEGKGK